MKVFWIVTLPLYWLCGLLLCIAIQYLKHRKGLKSCTWVFSYILVNSQHIKLEKRVTASPMRWFVCCFFFSIIWAIKWKIWFYGSYICLLSWLLYACSFTVAFVPSRMSCFLYFVMWLDEFSTYNLLPKYREQDRKQKVGQWSVLD